jgi:hypothetical protein
MGSDFETRGRPINDFSTAMPIIGGPKKPMLINRPILFKKNIYIIIIIIII